MRERVGIWGTVERLGWFIKVAQTYFVGKKFEKFPMKVASEQS